MEKQDKIDWAVLRGALITFIICLLISGVLAGTSYYFRESMQKEYTRNNALFQDISRRYLAVDQEEQLINQYFPAFVRAYNKGLIGREHRLNWIETLRQSGEKIKLPSLGYEIVSREEFIPGFQLNSGSYKLFSSEMNLRLGLLHEGDLVNLLNYLDRHAEGNYSVSECLFRRARSNIDIKSSIDKPNISATCVLQWFTINLASGNKLELS